MEFNSKSKAYHDAYNKQYYEKNKEAIKAKQRTIIYCHVCKLDLVLGSRSRHIKSQNHQTNRQLLIKNRKKSN
jgi:hypothetical protein